MRIRRQLCIILILVILLGNIQFTLAADIDSLTEYYIELSLNKEERIIEASERVVFTNIYSDQLSQLIFHLYPNSYRTYETLPSIGGVYLMEGEELPELDEMAKGYIDIQQVKIDGIDMEYLEMDQVLKISLDKPLQKGESIEVEIEFILKVPNGSHRLHEMGGSYSLTNWYPLLSIYNEETGKWDENPYHPIGESNYSDVSNYHVKMNVPKNMVVAPTGTIIDEKETGDGKIVNIQADKVRDFVVLMSPAYKVETREVDGIKISSYYMENLDHPNDESAVRVLDEVVKAVKFLNRTIGKYAYDELRIAETFLSGGAMEYPQVIQMGRYEDLSNMDIKERAPFTVEAAVHETIHQWWYVGVGNDEFNEPFLDEALTVFTTAYYFEKQYGEYHENGVNYNIRQNIYPSNMKALNSSVNDFENWGEYSQTIYSRGPAFFQDLRQRVGEEKFIKVLQNYYKEFKFKNASIEGLLRVIGKVAGEEIKGIMEKAITQPNYYPENIELTQEDRNIFYRRQEKRRLEASEEHYGLIFGSMILRALEGEKLILAVPDDIEVDKPKAESSDSGMATGVAVEMMEGIGAKNNYIVENFIRILMEDLKRQYGIDTVVIKEGELTNRNREENIIAIGVNYNNKFINELSKDLAIDMSQDTININGLTIKNKNLSGSFISKNPNYDEKLLLVIFLNEEGKENDIIGVEGSPVVNRITLYNYSPLYNRDIQFIINTGDIEIKGMYQ